MLLAIDVGNTQTVLGVYEGKKLRFRWRVATNKLHTCDELRVKLIPLLSSEGVSFDDIAAWRWHRWSRRSPMRGSRPPSR